MLTILIVLTHVGIVLILRRLWNHTFVSPILTTALALFYAMWYFTPAVLGLTLWSQVGKDYISADAFEASLAAESVALLAILAALAVRRPYFRSVIDVRSQIDELRPHRLLAGLLLGVGISTALQSRYGMGQSYIDRNSFSLLDQNAEAANSVGIAEFIDNMLVSAALACLVRRTEMQRGTTSLRFVSGLWLLIVTVRGLIFGSRVAALLPFMAFLIYARAQGWGRKRFIATSACAAMVTAAVGGGLAVIIADTRGKSEISASTVTDAVDNLSHSTDGSAEALTNRLSKEVFAKFDSFSAGAALIQAEDYGSCGWQPYEGAALALVPRFLLPTKPVPGSSDGTYFGLPSRIVARLFGMDRNAGNVGVSPAAIAAWELGIPGVVLMLGVNIWMLRIVNSLFLSQSLVGGTGGFFMLGLPSIAYVIAAPDVILMIAQRTALVILVVNLIGRTLIHRRARAELGESHSQPASAALRGGPFKRSIEGQLSRLKGPIC